MHCRQKIITTSKMKKAQTKNITNRVKDLRRNSNRIAITIVRMKRIIRIIIMTTKTKEMKMMKTKKTSEIRLN